MRILAVFSILLVLAGLVMLLFDEPLQRMMGG